MATVLICDDSEYLRLTIKQILNKMGHVVIGEASNGEEAVELYSKYRPDLVTMDVIMPKMNGLQALERILELDPEAKILIVTALSHEPLIKRALAMGALGFVIKPFSVEELMKGVNSVLSMV